MNKIILVLLLSLASVKALSCDEDLNDYWKPAAPKRVSKLSKRATEASDLMNIFLEAESSYFHKDFIEAHKKYYILYRKLSKEETMHDFNNYQLADIYEGLALSSWVVSDRKKMRANLVAKRALRKALQLDLPRKKKDALRFSLNFIKSQEAKFENAVKTF